MELGFSFVDDLGKYLGVLLLHRRVTKSTVQYIISNMRQKLAGWKAKTLSLADRLNLQKRSWRPSPFILCSLLLFPRVCAWRWKRLSVTLFGGIRRINEVFLL